MERAAAPNPAPQPGGWMKPPHPTLGFRKEEADVEGGHMGLGPAFLPVLVQPKLQQQDTEHTLHIRNPLTSETTQAIPPNFQFDAHKPLEIFCIGLQKILQPILMSPIAPPLRQVLSYSFSGASQSTQRHKERP